MAKPDIHLTLSVSPIAMKKRSRSQLPQSGRKLLPRENRGFGEASCCAAEQSPEHEGKETEIMNKAEIINSLSLSKLQDTHKYYSHQPGELIISWLLQCCATGANS